jgi:hypothetical protein
MQAKNNFKVDFSSAAIVYWPFSSVIDRNRNRPFNLIQNKVGYRKTWTIFMKQFWRSINFRGDLLPTWLCIESDVGFFLTLSGISCVTILKYTLILSPQFTKSTENKTSNQKEN